MWLGHVARNDVKVRSKSLEARLQLGVAGECGGQAASSCIRVGGAHQAGDGAADLLHPLEPLDRQEASQEAGAASQQHVSRLLGRVVRGGGGNHRRVEKVFEREVVGAQRARTSAVDTCKRGRYRVAFADGE
ncbi:unannotated protein [freshwater metagenome]|uniref:Unannotated protein n=1 Tax=freshwater metagenome TaxID=449393 RepID=A0A6J7C8Z4_9ZZZZ